MQDKLQYLTEKIYQEGITRGKTEAEAIISQARAEAEMIISRAQQEAEGIMAKAEKEAAELREHTSSEIKLSFRNALNSLKQEIENLILVKLADEPVSEVFSDNTFVARLIESVVEKLFSGSEPGDTEIIMPEDTAREIEQYLSSKTRKIFSSGSLQIHKAGMAGKGFEIKPHGKEFKIRITDTEFAGYIKEFLRFKLINLLFEQGE